VPGLACSPFASAMADTADFEACAIEDSTELYDATASLADGDRDVAMVYEMGGAG
jgi:hypothetical protein